MNERDGISIFSFFRDVADTLFRSNQGKYCQLAIA
jgi:hypothetical protein